MIFFFNFCNLDCFNWNECLPIITSIQNKIIFAATWWLLNSSSDIYEKRECSFSDLFKKKTSRILLE